MSILARPRLTLWSIFVENGGTAGMRWSENPFVFLLQFLGLLGPHFVEPFDLRVGGAHAPHPATSLIFPCRSSTAHPDHLPLQLSAMWASLIPEAVQAAPLQIPAIYERPVHSSATGHGGTAGMRWSENPFVFLLQGDGSAWPVYEKQVSVFFRANDTALEKQRDIFLASCGTRVFGLLLDLLGPATPHDKSLGELLATLRSHFSPAPSTLMERFRFNNRSRRDGETLGKFVAALRGLASGCAFREQLDSLHRDRFVCGINDPAMQKRLLELPDPSLDDAVKAALAKEAAAKDASELARAAGSPSTEAAVNKMATREVTLPLYLTKGPSPTLLGRNWIQTLGVRLPEYQEAVCAVEDVPNLLTKFKTLFQSRVGTFTGAAASIHAPDGAKPRFFKPRPLPFALKDGVTQELQRLQRDDVLVPVKSSEWAALIVPVFKQDGSLRICGDFKVTINPVATVEKYTLPRIEDLWSALSGGQKFTKRDLRDAYQQLVLQQSSRKYVTISTTLGLF
nr:uncharacterized protein LOC119173760 [Rhipicephalus microplus]